jgi:hypothetical protein
VDKPRAEDSLAATWSSMNPKQFGLIRSELRRTPITILWIRQNPVTSLCE